MKKISEILKSRKANGRPKKEIDIKTIESIFWAVLKTETKNVSRADVTALKYRDRKLFVTTTHPLSANEIWRNKKRIARIINELTAREIVEDIKVK